ncbi:O-methyltransferase [Lindgomyces ingoldianus]|uniref:O-methyltransferase n=1 Tax=Lindgomyces ingoldianus TaxID=673940 RepID=A0ACB6Q7R6_9PLEO|nr:O-methyltransferase [Lindgomyces ingoldianus]KAF2462855.1 O-methyltransferase [Lindgomyces ingoldianus]
MEMLPNSFTMDIHGLMTNMQATAQVVPSNVTEEERQNLLIACTTLRDALETPAETTLRTMLAGYDAVAFRLAIDMNLMDAVVSANGPVSIQKIASKISCDPVLVRRVVRLLACRGVFAEEGDDLYSPRPLAFEYSSGSPLAAAILHLSTAGPSMTKLPDYFAERGYRSPGDAFNGPWQYAECTDNHYFNWLSARPRLQNAFNIVMGIQRKGRGDEWFQFYPVEEKLRVKSATDPLLVDIGGGVGHDIIRFRQCFPTLTGQLILEDLPLVIEAAVDLPNGITAIGHDFFQPQPALVRNAKAYYLRTVLHDWPDKQARIILQNVKSAMSDESILLINEGILESSKVSIHEARFDLHMMARLSSLERTESQWRKLVESAGFELVKLSKGLL